MSQESDRTGCHAASDDDADETAPSADAARALSSAIEQAPDAVLLLDAGERVVFANAAMRALCGPAGALLLRPGENFRRVVERAAESGKVYGELPDSVEVIRANQRRTMALPVPVADNEAELMVARRMALHAAAPCDFEAMSPHGRWLHVATRVTPEGGRLIVTRDITTWKAHALQLEYSVLHDPATGIANRLLFMDRLDQELRRCARDRDRAFAIALLELDNFRLLNTGLGPDRGDAVLAAAARRIEHAVRPADTVARLEGDSFACIVDGLCEHDEAMEFARRLQAAFDQPVRLDGIEIVTPVSIGIAFGNRAVASSSDILRDAAIAVERAKQDRGLGIAVFDEVMRSTTQTRFQLDAELRNAIRNRQLTLAYQPIVDAETFRLVGFEALARWHHDTFKDVPPSVFIRIAEETGQIVPLGRLAVDIAATDLTRWLQHNEQLFVTVNISPRQFDEHNLADDLARAMEEHGLPAESLHLEITESTVVENPELVAESLVAIKQLGVRICLDDFGTGYSSLHLLQTMPYDVLKIDRSFVSALGGARRSQIIMESITQLAHRMGMRVVAEGVERHDQLARIRQVGCDFAQGFLFAPPLSSEEALRLVKAGRLDVRDG